VGLAGIGPGEWSLDHQLGWFDPPGWAGLGIALIAGLGGAAGLLTTFWRPGTKTMPTTTGPR
jgi:putative oxidoreductase